jgi:hypothetical protein
MRLLYARRSGACAQQAYRNRRATA